MEFYKLFHKRTDYRRLFEWIDRGFRPERWERHDEWVRVSACSLLLPLILCDKVLKNCKETDYV